MVERRDHVLITFLSPLCTRACTFLSRCSSIKGPFFTERGISFLSSMNAVFVCPWVMSGLESSGQHSPGALWMVPLASSFPSTHRVIDRVHRHTPDMGTAS